MTKTTAATKATKGSKATEPTWIDAPEKGLTRAGWRQCPCGRHGLGPAHQTKYANKACAMRAYHVDRATRAERGLCAPEKGRSKAQAPAKAPTAPKAAATPPRPAKAAAAPVATAPAPTARSAERDALLAAARSVDAPAPTKIEVVDLVPKPPTAPSLTPQGKPAAGKISDAIRACLGMPASVRLFYVKPGTVPPWCRRRRWRGGWRLLSDRRCFLGRNLAVIRAAAEGYEVDVPTGRLTLLDGTPCPNATLDHVRACRSALHQARYMLNLPSTVRGVVAQQVPYASTARRSWY